MTTFRDWLGNQESREDSIGWVAQYWRDLPDKPRLSSPNSIERHLQQRQLFDTQAGLREAWDMTMAEYRQQRMVTAATAAGVTPEQLASAVPAGERAAPQNAYTGWPQQYLEAMNAKLDQICAYLGLAAPQTAAPFDSDPIPWQELWDSADHEATIAE